MAAKVSISLEFGQFPRFREAIREYCMNAPDFETYEDRATLYRQVSHLEEPEWKFQQNTNTVSATEFLARRFA